MIDITIEYDGKVGVVNKISLPTVPRVGEWIDFLHKIDEDWVSGKVVKVTYDINQGTFTGVELFIELR